MLAVLNQALCMYQTESSLLCQRLLVVFKRAMFSFCQFFVTLNDPDPYDDEDKCPVIISVAQKQKVRRSEHAIGFKVFQCDLSDKKLDETFFYRNVSVSFIP